MTESDSAPVSANANLPEELSTRQIPRFWVASVCVVTFLAYIHTLQFQFVHDDRGQIVGNPAVHSWHAVPGYFTSHVWAVIAPKFLGNDYRPLFLLWLRTNDAIFGLHAAGWHFTTVAAHVLATYCVILLAYRIFREWRVALISGLCFGLHPVHIEGVAWISGVPEPLLAAELIPAYLCWLRSCDSGPASRWLGASLGLYALGLLTKETAVVLLLILFASQWTGFPRPFELQTCDWKQRSIESSKALLPFLLLTLIYFVVRTVALRGFSHPAAQISWLTVVLTWPSLLLFYARLLLWPVGLSPFYELKYVVKPEFLNAVLPALTLLTVALGLWRWASRSRSVALAIPWLIFPLLPVMAVQVFGDGNFAHNRYLYLPSVGFCMLVAAALNRIKLDGENLGPFRPWQLGMSLGLALLMVLAIHFEDRYYVNDAAFYSFAYSRLRNPDPVIGVDYANSLAEQGDFGHATEIYQKLIQAHPEMWSAYFNLGYTFYRMGELEPAVASLSRAANGDPTNAGAVFYLGLAEFKLNRLDAAEGNLRHAIELSPASPNYHFALGMVLKVNGNGPGAMAEFSRELELNPVHQAAAQQAAEIQRELVQR